MILLFPFTHKKGTVENVSKSSWVHEQGMTVGRLPCEVIMYLAHYFIENEPVLVDIASENWYDFKIR